MMLDSKAPEFSMRGRLCDITAAAYEVKRRRLYAAHLAREANRADRLRLLSMVLVLLLLWVSVGCRTSAETTHKVPAWKRTAMRDPEPPRPDTTFFRL